MAKCRICKRTLKNPIHAAAGIGPICAKKNRGDDDRKPAKPRVAFMSSPKTTARDPRSYLVKFPGEFWRTVRVFPDATGDGRTARCDCGKSDRGEICRHIESVAPADRDRFKTEVKNNENES